MKKKKIIIILIIVIAIALIGIGLYLIFGKKKTPDGPTISYNDLINFNNDTTDPNAWVPPDIDRTLKFDDYATYTRTSESGSFITDYHDVGGLYVSHYDEDLGEIHVIKYIDNPNLFLGEEDGIIYGKFTDSCTMRWKSVGKTDIITLATDMLNYNGLLKYTTLRDKEITPDMYIAYDDELSGYDYETRNNQSYIWEDNLTESDEYYEWFKETWGYDIRDVAQDWDSLSEEEKSNASYHMSATTSGNWRVVCDTTISSDDYIASILAIYNCESCQCNGIIYITSKVCDDLGIELIYEDVSFPEYIVQYAQGMIDDSLVYFTFDSETYERKD